MKRQAHGVPRRFAVSAMALLMGHAAWAGDTILVLKSRDLAPFDAAVAGFVEQWRHDKPDAVIRVQTLSDSLPESNPTAVVAVGTEAAKWAVANTTGRVVFCMVANAERNLLAGLDKATAARVSGIALEVPVKTQWRELKRLLPKAQRVGVLYDPQKSAAVVEEAADAAALFGRQLIRQEVVNEAALAEATESIASRIDVLWTTVDSTVYNSRNAQFVLTQMLQRRIPVMGFSENMVKAGALFGPRINYETIGRQAAELLRGRQPSDPLLEPRDFEMLVNGHVLKLVGNPIPPALIQQVSFIQP